MDIDYRTPDISEFVPGFVHEVLVNGKWHEERYDRDVSKHIIKQALAQGRIRRPVSNDISALIDYSDVERKMLFNERPDSLHNPVIYVPVDWLIRKFGHSLTYDELKQIEEYGRELARKGS